MKSFKIELPRSEVEDMVRERFNIPSYMKCSTDFPKGKIILCFDKTTQPLKERILAEMVEK